MKNRSFSSQLPAIHQTEVWNKFFGATVDQVFQPGKTVAQIAYLGRKPPYNSPETDFYKVERNDERSFYQLEPVLTTRDNPAADGYSNLMFYQDLVNHLRFQGADVSDHNKLFSTDYYSWSPPVNIHKLTKFNEYYWMPEGPPVLIYDIEPLEYRASGSQTKFLVPDSTVPDAEVSVSVAVDGDNVVSGTNSKYYEKGTKHAAISPEVFALLPSVIYDTRNLIAFGSVLVGVISSATREAVTHMIATNWLVDTIDVDLMVSDLTGIADTSLNSPLTAYFTNLQEAGVLSADAGIPLVVSTLTGTRKRFVDTALSTLLLNYQVRITGSYISAIIKWICESGDSSDLSKLVACFSAEKRRRNYQIVNGVVEFTVAPGKGRFVDIWANSNFEQYVNGKSSFRYEEPGKSFTPELIELGEVEVSHTPDLIRGMHLMIRDNQYVPRTWVVTFVNGVIKLETPSVATGSMIPHDTPIFTTIERGDTRPIAKEWATRNHWYHRSLVTFYDDNYTPTRASRPIIEFTSGIEMHASANFAVSNEPRFEAYDVDGVKLSDSTKYPSGFAGSRIFGYKKSDTNTIDSVLGFAVEWNAFGSILFEDELSPEYKINGVGPGLRFFKLNSVLTSNWVYGGKTNQTKTGEFWDLPANLTTNAMNRNFAEISENDWYQHTENMLASNTSPWAKLNSEFVRNTGNIIIQTRESMLRTMFLASDENIDFCRALAFNSREYLRYRSKFNQTLTRVLSSTNSSLGVSVSQIVDQVLAQLAATKSNEFPFINSGVGGGEWHIPATGAYLGATPLFTPGIYVEDNVDSFSLAIRGHDGSITKGDTKFTKVTTVNDGATNVVDTLMSASIIGESEHRALVLTYRREWVDTGLVETYQLTDPMNWAKSVELLETRIYESVPEKIRNQRRPVVDASVVRPSPFRTSAYTKSEYLAVTRPSFEKWASTAGASYRKNSIFSMDDRFTWNYRGSVGYDGSLVPGYWRGVYQFYLDTDRPHQTPWEMLGLTSKPVWWAEYYSWTNAHQRLAMVRAIERGFFAEPTTANLANASLYDQNFARPGIAAKLPVSTTGKLLDPISSGLVPVAGGDVAADWEYGDLSPMENKWRRSYEASFIESLHSYLFSPIQFIETNWLTGSTVNVNGEWLRIPTYDRSSNLTDFVHNEIINGSFVRKTGVQMWISDYLKHQGMDITANFGNQLRNIEPKLTHKVGGFVETNSIRAFTENIGMLPSEDVASVLYKSPSVKEEFYGGVIVEKTVSGWRVFGYDVVNPHFQIHKHEQESRRIKVSVTDSNIIDPNDWMTDTYYTVNVRVIHDGKAYRALQAHNSGDTFDGQFWVQIKREQSNAKLTVSWPLDFDKSEIQKVEYGKVFATRQEIADFLAGYQNCMESKGWVFETHDSELNATKDFKFSVREFLMWASATDIPDGMFISLSPCSDLVTFTTDHGTVRNVEQVVNGTSSILNREGFSIPKRDITAHRSDEKITVGSTGDAIYGLRLYVNEVEHALVFNNKTIFGDVLYDPLFGIRQFRIRISGNFATMEWFGRMECPGFVITDNTITPNFDRQADDIRYMFGIEDSINLPFRDSARHQIGYQSKDYLNNLVYNEANQFEFYQGMIQQKGAPGVFDKLLRNVLLRQNHTLNFLEEWAFRYGSYGGADRHSYFEFKLTSDEFKSNPQLITNDESITVDFDGDQVITLVNDDDRWVKPVNGSMFSKVNDFTTKKAALPDAGYARLSEVSYSFPNFDFLNLNVDTIGVPEIGAVFWLYHHDRVHGWDAFVASTVTHENVDIPGQVIGIEIATGGTRLYFDHQPSNVFSGDLMYIDHIITNASNVGYGYHRVIGVNYSEKFVLLDFDAQVDKAYDPEMEECPTAIVLRPRRITSRIPSDFRFINRVSGSSIPVMTGSSYGDFHRWVVSAINPGSMDFSLTPADGEYLYLDVCYDLGTQHMLPENSRRWMVVQYSAETQSYLVVRIQPPKIDTTAIADIRIFHDGSVRTDRELNAKPLLNNDILVWDPVSGLVPGVAQKEIKYKLNTDPAEYNRGSMSFGGSGSDWSEAQVGSLWWDMSTVFYLNACTDVLPSIPGLQVPFTSEEYTNHISRYSSEIREFKYRQTNWGKLAPSSSVDVYEWTKSSIPPDQWMQMVMSGEDPTTYDGEVYRGDDASYVETVEWDARLNREVPVYFFWVCGRKSTPRTTERKISAFTVQAMLSDPTSAGLSWVSPIDENSFIASNLSLTTDSQSTIEFKMCKSKNEVNKHVEWKLLRSGDERGLPDYYLWTRMMNSLIARNMWGDLIPDPELLERDRVGYEVLERKQNMFKDISAARRHLVQSVNLILSEIPVEATRAAYEVLNTNEFDSNQLQWVQDPNSYYIKPAPHHRLWNSRVDDSNKLNYQTGGQLLYDLKPGSTSWSVMGTELWDSTFYGDGDSWNSVNTAWNSWNAGTWDYTENSEEWESFMWDGAVVAIAYDSVQPSMDSIIDADETSLPINMRVMVTNTFGTGYWSLWNTVDDASKPGSIKFELVQMQRYRSSDIWEAVDWYAEGEQANVVPYLSFNSIIDRNTALGVNPTVEFVKMIDQTTGKWSWARFIDGEWVTVAMQLGTIRIIDAVWQNTGNFYTFPDFGDSANYSPNDVNSLIDQIKTKMAERDLGYELGFVINALREKVLTGLELNRMFFDMVSYAHTEQDFIDWCFKTSFMYITGYSDQLRQMPIKYADLTSSVLDYINEVKPYHVKIRDFISKYRAPMETVNGQITDFDLPPMVHPITGETRVLNHLEESDLLIINKEDKYRGWRTTFLPIITQVESGASNRVIDKLVNKSRIRQMNITRGNGVDDTVNFYGDETVDLEIKRTPVDANHQEVYDVGVPFWCGAITKWEKINTCHIHGDSITGEFCFACSKATEYDDHAAYREHHDCQNPDCVVRGTNVKSYFQLNCDGTINYQNIKYMDKSYNWDDHVYDDDSYIHTGDLAYVQRYLVADPLDTGYAGPFTSTPWDIEWNQDELMPGLGYSPVSDSYTITPEVDWNDVTIDSTVGNGMTLQPIRLLSAKRNTEYEENLVAFHVMPKPGVVAKIRIVNKHVERNVGSWIFQSAGAPIYEPI